MEIEGYLNSSNIEDSAEIKLFMFKDRRFLEGLIFISTKYLFKD